MYRWTRNEEEFEPRPTPRATPRPAPKQLAAAPSVPEVSLIFENAGRYGSPQGRSESQRRLETAVAKATSTATTTGLSSFSRCPGEVVRRVSQEAPGGSYAAWRERTFTGRARTEAEAGAAAGASAGTQVSLADKPQMGYQESATVSQPRENREPRRTGGTGEFLPPPESPRGGMIYQERLGPARRAPELAGPRVETGQPNREERLVYQGENDPREIFESPSSYPCVRASPTYQQPVPQFCYTDNQETVKNLLQLVNRQSEQIKALQSQVDRLLRMQEESLKERRRCSCSPFPAEQASTQGAAEPGRLAGRIPASPRRSNFLEQNVSIGVMTSFEFTVQNSPFADEYKKSEPCPRQPGNNQQQENLGESLRRYKSSFGRAPAGHQLVLENIVEDSESYLSSQRQSSNVNGSLSTRDHLVAADRQTGPPERNTAGAECPAAARSSARLLDADRPVLHDRAANRDSDMLGGQCPEERVPQGRRRVHSRKERLVEEPVAEEGEEDEEEEQEGGGVAEQQRQRQRQQQQPPPSTPASQSRTRMALHAERRKREQHAARKNCAEESLVLSGGDLRVTERPPPTPEPSIHVEMQEYSSDEESDKPRRSSKVGWTFYNNVLGQVNHILRNSCVIEEREQREMRNLERKLEEQQRPNDPDPVKLATLEQLRKLGISLTESPDPQNEPANGNVQREFLGFDSSFYPRLDRQANLKTQPSSTAVNETNTSMHMKALALKYLSDEQLGELALQRQGSVKQLMLSNLQGTNMSFATMRYLERYQLLPGGNPPPPPSAAVGSCGSAAQEHSEPQQPRLVGPLPGAGQGVVGPGPGPGPEQLGAGARSDAQPKGKPGFQRFGFGQTPRTSCPSKILDISTLKQQPKLL